MLNKIILASKSKVRKEILDKNNIPNSVEPANIDEDPMARKITALVHASYVLRNVSDVFLADSSNSIDRTDKNWSFLVIVVDLCDKVVY